MSIEDELVDYLAVRDQQRADRGEMDPYSPPSADGRQPAKVYFDFGDRRWSAASYPRADAPDVYDVEVFTRTDWSKAGFYSAGEHVGTIVRVDDDTWRAESDKLGRLPAPDGGYDFPTQGNALVNVLIATKPRLPRTMLPRAGLPLMHPMRGACNCRRRCPLCTSPPRGRRG